MYNLIEVNEERTHMDDVKSCTKVYILFVAHFAFNFGASQRNFSYYMDVCYVFGRFNRAMLFLLFRLEMDSVLLVLKKIFLVEVQASF